MPTKYLHHDFSFIRKEWEDTRFPYNLSPMSGREILQTTGDIFRFMGSANNPVGHRFDVIVERTMENVDEIIAKWQPAVILIGDIRQRSELEAVKARGGRVARLLRNVTTTDKHSTETELDDNDPLFDDIIDNECTLPQFLEMIRLLPGKWGWK